MTHANNSEPVKKITVSQKNGEWEVKNEGDEAVLFKSSDKETALHFAKNMRDTHKVFLEVDGKDEEHKSGEKSGGTDNRKPARIIVREDRDVWVVKHEDDSAVLFSSTDKEAAMKFASDMGREHKIEVKVL